MNKNLLPLAAAVMLAMSGCGGGGGSSSGSGGTTNSDGEVLSSQASGIEIPSEISAIPADTSGATSKTVRNVASFSGAVRALGAVSTAELSATSDYAKATPSVYVEERSLEQFEIIEIVFQAVAQTHYADEENVNAGPYKAIISWEEESNGKDVKQLQTWTVESRMIVMDLPSDVTGNTTGDVNKLYAWIPEIDRETGEEELIKAEFLIYTAPTKADDGSLLDYGEWDLNVLMAANPSGVDTIPVGGPDDFFAASARVGSDGSSVLKVHDKFTEVMDMDGPGGAEPIVMSEGMQGILYRNGFDGYGMVSYPDWESCWQGGGGGGENPCAGGIPTNVAKYAYNANYLGLQEVNDGTGATPVYKDRAVEGAINVVHRYELFYADADSGAGISEGDNVKKHLSFGFPVTYQRTASSTDTSFNEFAYYGAWQGRHQLWGPGGITPTSTGSDGTTLTRQDVRPGDPVPTYKLKEFSGTFTKRTLVNADLDEIKDIAVETWLNDHFDMFYRADPDMNPGTADADWFYCDGGHIDWSGFPPVCRDKATDNDIGFTALTGSSLMSQLQVASGDRRWVNVGRCDGGDCRQYVYVTDSSTNQPQGYTSPGFYEALWGEGGLSPLSPAALLSPTDGMNLWVDIGGSIYVAYDGDFTGGKTGWVQKTLESFDQQTWTPTFVSGSDVTFTPERGVEYYMNAKGMNYVVKRTDADATAGFQEGDYSARLELQIAANPNNTNASASILPTGTAYLAAPWNADVKLTLVSAPDDANYLLLQVVSDATNTYATGDLYTADTWGLVAYNNTNAPLASDGSTLVVDAFGWIDPNANAGKEAVQFNFEYAGTDGNDWGKQQFLINTADSSYVILSDPLNLVQVGLYDNLGNPVKADPDGAAVIVGTDEDNWKKVSLQFDGWMHGLPDMHRELEKNGWSIAGLGDKVRLLKAGQTVSDGTANYFVKPMETSLFLGIVNAFPLGDGQPDITQADGVDLTSVPDYTPHEMGAAPTTGAGGGAIEVKYSEGKALE